MDEPTTPSQSKRILILIVSAVIIAVIAAYLGYLLGQNSSSQSPAQKGEVAITQMADNVNSAIIVHQSATAVGKVISVENNSVTLQSESGVVLGFKVGPGFNIYNPSTASASGTPNVSQDLKDITLNQKYVVDLILQDGSYVIVTMNRVRQ